MPADARIEIRAENHTQQAFRETEQALRSLENQSRELQQATRATAAAMGLLGDEARETAREVDKLGRQVFQTREEAQRFGGVWRDTNGVLRDARGRFAGTTKSIGDFTRSLGGASSGAGILATSVGGLGNVIGALGIVAVTAQLSEFARGSVDAATKIEGFRNGLTALYGDAQIANKFLADLDRLSELPGITFEGAVQGAIRLKTVSVEGERAVDVIREFGNAAALAGNGSEELGRAMIGLSQAIARGRIDQENLNQILENVPLIGASIREAFGSIEAQTIQDQLDAAGQSVHDFVDILVNQLETQARASVDSTANVFSNLGNALFRLQSELGEQFLPFVKDATIGLTNFLDAIREGVDDVSTLPPEIQAIIAGAESLRDSVMNVAEAIASAIGPEIKELASALATLLGSILDLAGSIINILEPAYKLWAEVQAIVVAAITKLAMDINSIIGVLTDFIDWVASAWQEEDKFTESTQRVTQAIEEVKEAVTDASGSFQEYAGNLSVLLTELQSVNAELEEKKARLKELEAEGLTPADASLQQIHRQIGLLEERSKSLTESLPDLKQTLEDVNSQLEQKRNNLKGMTESGDGASASAQQLQRQIATLTTLANLLNAQIALTPPALSETSEGMDTAKEATENYSLTLARLKARAEDARETLSNTIDFQKLSTNYRAAIAESDAYYDRQIANAEEALSKEKENTDEYRKIETDLFELRREKEQARKKLAEDASKVGETESKRRLKVAEEEQERLREAGEETARALAASQKAQAQATAEAQKELTRLHQENLKEREEADRATNQRIVKASEDQLKILADIFENGSTEGVNQAYQNIQRATIQHYETLKSQARQRITDEDALTAELVKLDRERNAALAENHRDYLQRIANDAKKLLGERTEAFQEASGDILHNWERTVSAFERQLREADTEDAIRQIESDFESGQQNMLTSLESVITELGFTAEQSAEIMKEILRTAESESDSFADKVISAFKRLGKEINRETKRQNRELEKSYRELISNIGDTIGQVGDLLGDGLGGTLESVFSGLVRTASGDLFGLVDIATSAISFIQAREEELHRRRQERAKERQEFEDEQSIRVQNIQRVQQILPNAESNIRRPRPRDVDAELNRGVNARRRVPAALQDLQGITLQGVSSDVLSQLQSQQLAGSLAALTTNLDDIISRSDIEELYQRFLNSFETAMDAAGLSFQTAIDRGLSDAEITAKSAEFLGAINDFYDLQIEQIRNIEAATGSVLFDEIQALNNLRSERLNQARLLTAESTRPNLTTFGFQRSVQEARATAERTGTDQAYTEQIARAQYGDETYDAEVAAAEVDQETLASVIESINEDVALINASITSIETRIEQSNDPTQIAELLSQVPDLIREKYTRLREALNARLSEGEISQNVFDASLSELASGESRDLESHSDAVLANTIQAINEDVSLINASVVALHTQIEQVSEPAEIAELLLQVPDLIREKYRQLRDALDARYNAGEISVDIYNASLSELASSETADLEQHSDAVLANTLRAINENVQLIDASITALQTQIDGLSEPEAIAELLSQLPALIQEKYQTLRTALDTRYAAGEISLDVYNASLSQLESRETAELENHADQILANTLRAIDEDAGLINASITALQNQIDQTSEPAEIARLLDQLPALITEKYRLLRNALDEKYAAGEISTDVYNASLTQLANSHASEIENQSDRVLANTLADIDDDVALIDANIESLQFTISQSDDPAAIAGFLEAIKVLITDKYKQLRDRLSELHAAEEISADSYNAALTALGTAENNALANIDTQAFNTISEAAQEQVDFINGSIENLRTSLELTDDPTEIQQILDAIRVLTASRFDTLRDELEAIRSTLSPEEYDQAFEGLNLAEQLALENIDTEKFAAISAEAQKQVDLINGSIENLRLSLQFTENPAEIQQILEAIRVLTVARFQVLRDELEKLKDTLDDDQYEQALTGINLSEQLALQNIDTEKFSEISEAAQTQVSAINKDIENLRLSLQLTDDPAERQGILFAIRILTKARFAVLREELEKLKDTLDDDDYDRALRGINLSEKLAVRNIDTEKFGEISEAAQAQVAGINTDIENLRLALQLTDDPTERQDILDAIRILTVARFAVLREELEKLKSTLSEEDYARAVRGLNLAESVALQNINTEKFSEISEAAQGQVDAINTDIENLRLSLQLTDDPTERQAILDTIRLLTTARFQVLRDELESLKETLDDEGYSRALKGINLSEQLALQNIDTEKFSEISTAAQEQVEFINGSIENLRLSLQLTDDPAETQQILDAIKILTTKRFKILRDELNAIRESFDNDDQFNQALMGINLAEQLAIQNLDTEKFEAISVVAQEQVDLINGSIENLRLSLQLTDDPTDRQAILDAIKILTAKRFDILIQELKDIRENFDNDEQFKQALTGLELGKTLALENIDTEKFSAISGAAQGQVDFINTDIENLRLAFELTDDPTERQQVLDAIKILISARFDVLRDELEKIRENLKPGEYDQALKGFNLAEQVALNNINTEKFAEISAEAKKQVELLNGHIENLRLSFELTDDPAERQQILDAIKALTAARFDILIQELKDIEASLDDPAVFKQALEGLELGKTLALENLDTEKFSQISAAAQEQVDFINSDIENLRLSLQLTDDPAERQQILNTIRALTKARFDVLRKELFAIRESFDNDDEFNQTLKGLNLAEQLALENIDTEKFSEISAEAQKQADFINGSIENLRLSLQLTDDPTETQQILDAIKILTTNRFNILIQELKNIRDNFDSNDEFEQALEGLELGKTLALENLNTEKFSAISAAAQEQVGFINGAIENLRLSFELTDDPTEQQEIIESIRILTAKRFEILRDELFAIRENFDNDAAFQQALSGLNLGERLALSQLDTERFGVISQAAQEQVDFINGAISNLELSLQLTDDPDEIQRILASIRTLTGARFDVLIQELKDLETSLDPAEFNQALEGLQLGKAVALRGIDDRSISVGLAGITSAISDADFQLNQLFEELGSETTATGVSDAVARLRTAIEKKYELLREKINASAEAEEEKARQIENIDFQEGQALDQLGQRGLGQFNSLLNTAQFLLDTATETEFSTRRGNLINAINTFYDERIRFIESQDLPDTDRANMLAVARIQRQIALDAIPEMHASVVKRLELESQLQANIQDLRDESFDLEVERQERLVALEEDTQDRISDIQARAIEQREDALRRSYFALEDLTIEFARDFEDLFRESGLDLDADNLGRLRQAIQSGFDISDDLLQQLNIELDEETRRELEDLTREFSRDRQDLQRERQNRLLEIQIQEQRSIADARNASEQQIIEINARLVTGQQELTTAIETLTAELETVSADEGIQETVGGLQVPVEAVTTIATESLAAAQSSEMAAGSAAETSTAMEMTAGHLATVTETQNDGVVERLDAMVQRLDTLIEVNQELLGVTLLGSEILPRQELELLGVNVPTGLDFGIRNRELLEAFGQTVSDTRLPDTLQNFISETETRLRTLGRQDEFPRFLNELQLRLPDFISDAIGREFRGAPSFFESQLTLDEVTRNIARELRLPTGASPVTSPVGIPAGNPQQLFNAQGQPVEVVFNFNLDSTLQWEDGATQSLGNSFARVNVNRSGLE